MYDEEAGGYKPAGMQEGAYVSEAESMIRKGFIRKVYSILLVQILATIGMACLFMFNTEANDWVLSSPNVFIGAIVLTFILLFATICNRRKYPLNVGLLALWTIVEAFTVGVLCAAYARQGAGEIVLQAFIITGVIFLGESTRSQRMWRNQSDTPLMTRMSAHSEVPLALSGLAGLTVFTLQSKIDMSPMGSFLGMGLLALIAWGIIVSILGWRISWVFALLGALLFRYAETEQSRCSLPGHRADVSLVARFLLQRLHRVRHLAPRQRDGPRRLRAGGHLALPRVSSSIVQ